MAWKWTIENVAGIRHGEADFEEGLNVVSASNWQGKSSFVTAVETAMGTDTSLTEGADEGRVSLETDEGTYEVTLTRRDGTIVRSGTPYLSGDRERVCADLYAFFDENNRLRQAVGAGENLEALLTKPLDFENIDQRIADLKDERQQVDAELERAKEAERTLPSLESQVSTLESELHELEAEREELLGDDDPDTVSKRERLGEVRAERESVEDLIAQLEETIERTEGKLSEHHGELEGLDVPASTDIEEELAEVHDEMQETERDIELLQSVYTANRRLLEEDRLDLVTDVDYGLIGDTIACWTCGESASREEFEAQVDTLGDQVMELREHVESRRERVESLQAERDEHAQKRRKKGDLEDEIQRLESTISDRKESLSSAHDRLEMLDEQVEVLSEDVEALDDRLTDLESEIKYTEAKLDEVKDEIRTKEQEADQRSTLESEYETLTEEIHQLRNRKDEVKSRTREAFDEALSEVLDRFDTGFETARLTGNFELVVARNDRETDVSALSEGEVDLLALVATLAALEAHEVTKDVPVMLLDSLGGLSASNLRTLVEYLENEADYVVFTAYPEHDVSGANELDPSEWDVVSNESPVQATSD